MGDSEIEHQRINFHHDDPLPVTIVRLFCMAVARFVQLFVFHSAHPFVCLSSTEAN